MAVTVFADTTMTMTTTTSVQRGAAATISGQLVTTIGQAPLAAAPVQILLTPAIGNQVLLQLVTDANGHFTTKFVPTSNTTVAAGFAATDKLGTSKAVGKVGVRLGVLCKATPTSVRLHGLITVRCTAPGMRTGVKTVLQVATGRSWTSVMALNKGTTARLFHVKAVGRGTLALRVTVPTNHYFVSSTSRVFAVRVR